MLCPHHLKTDASLPSESPPPHYDYTGDSSSYTGSNSPTPTKSSSGWKSDLLTGGAPVWRKCRKEGNLPSREVAGKFRASSVPCQCPPGMGVKDWIRIATWWVLKSAKPVLLSRRQDDVDLIASESNVSDLPNFQAFVDLQKAAWIVYEVIVGDEEVKGQMGDEEKRLLCDVIDEIEYSFECLEVFRYYPEEVVYDLNFSIWEPRDVAEEGISDFPARPRDPQRWLRVHEEDAGQEDERLLFRAFVNASIVVSKDRRTRTTGAPYMLLLWAIMGKGELQATLRNQTGSMAFTGDFTHIDLISMRSIELAAMLQRIHLKFGTVDADVEFIRPDDYEGLKGIVSNFFDAMKERQPREGERREPVFHAILDQFELLESSGKGPDMPIGKIYHGCDMRIYESKIDDLHVNRRLVLSSAPHEIDPWSTSFFIPLCNVHLNKLHGLEMLIKYSDLGHRRVRTFGDYVPRITYYYDKSHPNTVCRVLFLSESDLIRFSTAVLRLLSNPFCTHFAGRETYTVAKTAPYKSLTVTHHSEWTYTELYRLPRNTDLTLIPFPTICHTSTQSYLTTHTDLLFDTPQPNLLCPLLSSSPLALPSSLCLAVTANWTLESVSTYPMVTVQENPRIKLPFKSRVILQKGPAEISLWRRATERRLLARFGSTALSACLLGAARKGPSSAGSGISTASSASSGASSSKDRDKNKEEKTAWWGCYLATSPELAPERDLNGNIIYRSGRSVCGIRIDLVTLSPVVRAGMGGGRRKGGNDVGGRVGGGWDGRTVAGFTRRGGMGGGLTSLADGRGEAEQGEEWECGEEMVGGVVVVCEVIDAVKRECWSSLSKGGSG